jgi:hypothetical protein
MPEEFRKLGRLRLRSDQFREGKDGPKPGA